MSIHDGHRQRMRERFDKHGLDSFSEHEILELLLYYCIPRSNTNAVAHRLIQRFGSLVQVMEATAEELQEVEGIGASSALFLSLLQQTYRRMNISTAKKNISLAKPEQYSRYLREFFFGRQNEVVYLVCLDAKGTLIDCYEICEGGVHTANVPMRKIIDIAIRCKAVTVILAHNHPGGLALPSYEDVQTTRRLAKALYSAEVILMDHVIVAGKDYLSMRRSGEYDIDEVLSEV